MIEGTISFIEQTLNAYKLNKMQFKEERVISSNLVEQDGSLAVRDDNSVVISLVILDQDSTLKNTNRTEMRPSKLVKAGIKASVLLSLGEESTLLGYPFSIC